MNILFIGDMVAPRAIAVVARVIRRLKKEKALDLVVANGENIHTHNGLNLNQYEALLDAGVDVVTLGNHCWDQAQIYHFIDDAERLVRPFNYPPGTPGHGVRIVDAAHRQVAVIAAMGNVMVSTLTSPFQDVLPLVEGLHKQGVRHIIVDIHAEATSEKTAFAHYLDGKVSAVFGTHTHVATADARILPNGTAYQTDVGMVGPYHSVIGMDVNASISRFVSQRRIRYVQSEDVHFVFHGTMVTLDDRGLAVAIEPISETLEIREEPS